MFNYVRPRCLPTAARHLHILKPWLRAAPFPLSEAGKEAIEQLKAHAVQIVAMSTVDEEAAINAFHPSEEIRYKDGPVRPLESLADSSGYAIGAGLVQMVKELLDLNLCGTYSAGLTITQMQQHPSSQELWSQLMSKV